MPENMEQAEIVAHQETEQTTNNDNGFSLRKWLKELVRQVSQHDVEDLSNDSPWVRLHVPTSPVMEFGATISGKRHEILDIVPGSYADELKLRAGDELAGLSGVDLSGVSSAEVRRLFRLVHGEVELIVSRQRPVQCGFLVSSRQQEYEEIRVNVSCPDFQRRIIQSHVEYPLGRQSSLRQKKVYTAYVKSIFCSNAQITDCCWKVRHNQVIAAPIRNGEEQWHTVRIHNYRNFTRTDGISCLLEIGPNKNVIACRRDATTNQPTVYLRTDVGHIMAEGDDRLFIKKMSIGRTIFESAILPNVYLYVDGTILTAKLIPDTDNIDNKSKFDVFPKPIQRQTSSKFN